MDLVQTALSAEFRSYPALIAFRTTMIVHVPAQPVLVMAKEHHLQ